MEKVKETFRLIAIVLLFVAVVTLLLNRPSRPWDEWNSRELGIRLTQGGK